MESIKEIENIIQTCDNNEIIINQIKDVIQKYNEITKTTHSEIINKIISNKNHAIYIINTILKIGESRKYSEHGDSEIIITNEFIERRIDVINKYIDDICELNKNTTENNIKIMAPSIDYYSYEMSEFIMHVLIRFFKDLNINCEFIY